ncbi:sugar transferase [Chryseobacterium culicis]|uniref:Sugar transferase involved in LPS biosynthesis (Colanic, teichoic acid) n=1 Tax=Chryseobacterium culicis TaxID=680127 RepID=A0A1H6GZ52_CHRCI|nr:sugar transferase [Chryseobacterium culicis]MBE4947644.1 sugar transferase [Chryseobacterium culicis]SEH28651.1 Sugar transferase involved in LPS biosynthesis (colanic, teichoic acid) [Chryseobacterium culicis]
MYRRIIKRFLDIIISFTVILFLFPLFLVVYILVKLDSPGKFFFFQERLGYKGQVFKIYKIRTMYDKERVADREILKGDVEVTKIGHYLRRFKIDELPQIINVFQGDMSLVGPRPCLPRQLEEFNEDGKMRIKVTPGLTGLAQVNGNIHLSWEERWKYDREYVEKQSLLLDLKIVFKTFLILLNGEDKYIKRPNV